MSDKRLKLEQALSELDDVNDKLRELAKQSTVYTQYTVEYARHFLASKKSVEGLKSPSDELAKQYTLAKVEMLPFIEAYNAVKFETEIYLKLSGNLQAKIFALKSSIADENRSENAQ